MEYIKEEKEINIKEMIFYICLKWRVYLVVLITSILLILGLNARATYKFIPVLGKKIVFWALAKNMFIYIILILVLIVGVRALKYIFSDAIKSINEYNLMCKIKCLGIIPEANQGKRSVVDKLLYRYNGVKVARADRDVYIERICNLLKHNLLFDSLEAVNIAIVSSCSSVESSELQQMFEKKKLSINMQIFDAGDIINSAEGVKKVSEAQYVILAERQGKSKYSELNQTCKQLSSWNKEILGTVLLDVEAL